MAVVPGAGHPAGTVANALRGLGRPLSTLEGPLRPGLLHRLDSGTSGVLACAKHDDAHRRLISAFLARAVRRRYLAVVTGWPVWDETTVDAPIAPPRPGRKARRVEAGGRPAQTGFRVLARLPGGLAVVEAAPATGRTHQIRVHLAHLGHPIAGDTLYAVGAARTAWRGLGLRRPLLHAARLEIDGIVVTAPAPPDLARVAGGESW